MWLYQRSGNLVETAVCVVGVFTAVVVVAVDVSDVVGFDIVGSDVSADEDIVARWVGLSEMSSRWKGLGW